VPDLKFRVESASPVARAAVPMINFRVRVLNAGPEPVRAAAVVCRIEIDAPRRPTAEDRERLKDLFGESSRWADSGSALLWTSATMVVPAFSETAACDLLAPCSFDFNVAATKYFYGLQERAAPLRFHFSGQVVFENSAGGLESAAFAQEQACYPLPLSAWSELMDDYYPSSMWLRLPREIFERLYQYKTDRAIPTWEDVFDDILPTPQELVN